MTSNLEKIENYKLLGVSITVILLSIALINNLFFGDDNAIFSFAIVHFLGYLFFIFLPVELLFFFYLTQDFNPLILFIVAISSAIFAQTNDYLIGYLNANNFEHFISKKKYIKFSRFIKKYGYPIILIFNLSPFSSPVVLFVSGIMRVPLNKALMYSLLGLTIKYTTIIALYFVYF